MDQRQYDSFKTLLLGLPGWNLGSNRKAFLQDAFWENRLLNQVNYEVSGDQAATDLIELLVGIESLDENGLSPACKLLVAIRE